MQPRVISQGSGRSRGQVVLAVQVRPNGSVGDVEVLSRRDDRRHDDLERAAVSAVSSGDTVRRFATAYPRPRA